MPAYRVNPAVIETDLGEELVLLDPATREMFSLNATGRLVWRALSEGGGGGAPGRAVERAVERIVAAFEVDADAARADVDTLVSRLAAAGLIVASVEGGATAG